MQNPSQMPSAMHKLKTDMGEGSRNRDGLQHTRANSLCVQRCKLVTGTMGDPILGNKMGVTVWNVNMIRKMRNIPVRFHTHYGWRLCKH